MDWLNYHHLLYFWMVAREGSIARASEKLMLAQPTISTQIKALETALGEKLFERRGRRLAMTQTGEMVYGYADEIFSLGRELLSALRQEDHARPLRLHVGVTDSLPKMVAYELLRPAFQIERPVQLICREGKIATLLSDLATHQLDVVLADTPGSPAASVKSFNHLLGQSQLVFLAAESLAEELRDGFPASLHGAPGLLPTSNVAMRLALDRWFAQQGVEPQIVAEVEDSALAKVFASEGLGFIAAPEVIAETVGRRYGLAQIGAAEGCAERYYAITVERRLKHPAVIAVSDSAREQLLD